MFDDSPDSVAANDMTTSNSPLTRGEKMWYGTWKSSMPVERATIFSLSLRCVSGCELGEIVPLGEPMVGVSLDWALRVDARAGNGQMRGRQPCAL